MRSARVNYTIPKELHEKLNSLVKFRERSSFVAKAIEDKLKLQEKEELKKQLAEGYKARAVEDKEISKDWEVATMENWDD